MVRIFPLLCLLISCCTIRLHRTLRLKKDKVKKIKARLREQTLTAQSGVAPRTACMHCQREFSSRNQLFHHLQGYPSHAKATDFNIPDASDSSASEESKAAHHLGDWVECRNSGKEWKKGVVTSEQPLKVTPVGWEEEYSWEEVRPTDSIFGKAQSQTRIKQQGSAIIAQKPSIAKTEEREQINARSPKDSASIVQKPSIAKTEERRQTNARSKAVLQEFRPSRRPPRLEDDLQGNAFSLYKKLLRRNNQWRAESSYSDPLHDVEVTVTLSYPKNIDCAWHLLQLAKRPLEIEDVEGIKEQMEKHLYSKDKRTAVQLLDAFAQFREEFPLYKARQLVKKLERGIAQSKAVNRELAQAAATTNALSESNRMDTYAHNKSVVQDSSELIKGFGEELTALDGVLGEIKGESDEEAAQKMSDELHLNCQKLAMLGLSLAVEAYTVGAWGSDGRAIEMGAIAGMMAGMMGGLIYGIFVYVPAAGGTGGIAILVGMFKILAVTIGAAIGGAIALAILAAAVVALGVWLYYKSFTLTLSPQTRANELVEVRQKVTSTVNAVSEKLNHIEQFLAKFEKISHAWMSNDGPRSCARAVAGMMCKGDCARDVGYELMGMIESLLQ